MLNNLQARRVFQRSIDLEKITQSITANQHRMFQERLGLSAEDYRVRLRAFVKFISVQSVLGESRFIPVSAEVDAIWHEFILQTAFYRQFCLSLPGNCFIDHQSIGFQNYLDKERLGGKESLEHVMLWLGLHYGYFGEFKNSDRSLWTAIDFLSKEMGYSLDEINSTARNIYHSIVKKARVLNGQV